MTQCYLFTAAYPYTDKEAFVHTEIALLAQIFDKVTLLPLNKLMDSVVLPANVEAQYIFEEFDKQVTSTGLFKKLGLCFDINFVLDFFKNIGTITKKRAVLKNYVSQFIHNKLRVQHLSSYFDHNPLQNSDYCYNYWFDNWATVLGLYKKKNPAFRFISRIHGYELYPEQNNLGFFPFRRLQLKSVAKLYPVSQGGKQLLISQHPRYSKKIETAYLGTADQGTAEFDTEAEFTIVSCAHIAAIKRVERIGEVLKHINFPVKWVHFGGFFDDEIEAKESLLKVVKELNDHSHSSVKAEMMGSKSNSEIMEFYKKNSVNLFISLSSTEGIPVTMMEAISFGIPVLSTDVGSCKEIVTPETGLLVNSNESVENIAKAILEFKDGQKNTKLFRNGVRLFWAENFNQENNLRKFIKSIAPVFN